MTLQLDIFRRLPGAAAVLSAELEIMHWNEDYQRLSNSTYGEIDDQVPVTIGLDSEGVKRLIHDTLKTSHEVSLGQVQLVDCLGDSQKANIVFLKLRDDKNKVLGILQYVPLHGPTPTELLALRTTLASLQTENTELRIKLAQVESELAQSRIDPLTGVLQRGAFMELAQHTLEISRRMNQQAAVLMLDLDHFKSVNDTHGHQAGDEVLKAAAAAVKGRLRKSDILGRYGGEDFLAVLPNVSRASAFQVANECLEQVAGIPISKIIDGADFVQTVSIGLALFPEEGQTLDGLICLADEALYDAKSSGRATVRDVMDQQNQIAKVA